MFKHIKTTLFAATVVLAGASGAVLADTVSQEQVQPVATSVAQILQDVKDDQRVSLKGQITKQLSKEKFLFNDGSGEIQLDIDDELTKVTPINPPVAIQLMGEVDKGLVSDTEIEVKSYTLAQ